MNRITCLNTTSVSNGAANVSCDTCIPHAVSVMSNPWIPYRTFVLRDGSQVPVPTRRTVISASGKPDRRNFPAFRRPTKPAALRAPSKSLLSQAKKEVYGEVFKVVENAAGRDIVRVDNLLESSETPEVTIIAENPSPDTVQWDGGNKKVEVLRDFLGHHLALNLNELRHAFLEMSSDLFDVSLQESETNEVMKWIDYGVKQIVKFALQISSFCRLQPMAGQTLLREATTEMLLLRSVFCLNDDNSEWNFFCAQLNGLACSAKISVKALGAFECSIGDALHSYRTFAQGVSVALRGDNKLLVILLAMILFYPDRKYLLQHPNTQHTPLRELFLIRSRYNTYERLLKNYLQSKLGCEHQTKDMFDNLVAKLAELRVLKCYFENATVAISRHP